MPSAWAPSTSTSTPLRHSAEVSAHPSEIPLPPYYVIPLSPGCIQAWPTAPGCQLWSLAWGWAWAPWGSLLCVAVEDCSTAPSPVTAASSGGSSPSSLGTAIPEAVSPAATLLCSPRQQFDYLPPLRCPHCPALRTPHLLWHSCISSRSGSSSAVLLVTASNTASRALGGSAAATWDTMSAGLLSGRRSSACAEGKVGVERRRAEAPAGRRQPAACRKSCRRGGPRVAGNLRFVPALPPCHPCPLSLPKLEPSG